MKKKINAFVTGGSRGIGHAISKRISQKCESLFITSSNEKTLKAGLDKLKIGFNGNLYGEFADHNHSEAAAIKYKNWVAANTDKLDLLVLNAGMFIEGDLCSIDNDSFILNMEVNFMVNHYIIKELIPFLKKSDCAKIILIGSTAAYEAYPLVPTYGAAKWALRGYAINLRKELMQENIAVTFISPGGTLTDMWEGEELPKNRLLEPDDIAKVVDSILTLSKQAVIEELIIRPMLGDIHE